MMYRTSVLLASILLTGQYPQACLGHSGGSSPSSSAFPHDGNGDDNPASSVDVTSFPFFRPPPFHFSSIGFGMHTDRTLEGTENALMKLAEANFNHRECKLFPSKVHPGRDLLVLRSRCGAEFWGSVDTKHHTLTGGPDPHFRGLSRMRIKVNKKLEWENGD